MGIDQSVAVYLPNFNFWARDIYITPVASQGVGVVAYKARGIWSSNKVDVMLDEGSSISDQYKLLFIRTREFAIPPKQNDLVNIPADGDVPAEGDFQIIDVNDNGGGQLELQLHDLRSS